MVSESIINEIKRKIFPSLFLRSIKQERKKYSITKDTSQYEDLKPEYERVITLLNIKWKDEVSPTRFEKQLVEDLKALTKLDVLQSVWIGNHCIDIFIPGLGYAIEVDGSVHDKEHKMRKDSLRDKNLGSIGINVMSVPNNQIEYLWPAFLIHFRKEKKILSTYQKRKMWRDIYIITLLAHSALSEGTIEVSNDL